MQHLRRSSLYFKEINMASTLIPSLNLNTLTKTYIKIHFRIRLCMLPGTEHLSIYWGPLEKQKTLNWLPCTNKPHNENVHCRVKVANTLTWLHIYLTCNAFDPCLGKLFSAFLSQRKYSFLQCSSSVSASQRFSLSLYTQFIPAMTCCHSESTADKSVSKRQDRNALSALALLLCYCFIQCLRCLSANATCLQIHIWQERSNKSLSMPSTLHSWVSNHCSPVLKTFITGSPCCCFEYRHI